MHKAAELGGENLYFWEIKSEKNITFKVTKLKFRSSSLDRRLHHHLIEVLLGIQSCNILNRS